MTREYREYREYNEYREYREYKEYRETSHAKIFPKNFRVKVRKRSSRVDEEVRRPPFHSLFLLLPHLQ